MRGVTPHGARYHVLAGRKVLGVAHVDQARRIGRHRARVQAKVRRIGGDRGAVAQVHGIPADALHERVDIGHGVDELPVIEPVVLLDDATIDDERPRLASFHALRSSV